MTLFPQIVKKAKFADTLLWFLLLAPLPSCEEGGGVLLFSIEDDIKLGRQVADEIASQPQQYPVLDEARYPEAYRQLRRILGNVLLSPDVQYRDRFAYQEIKIIADDNTLNAFATPGGHIYVYSGLIKFLDTEDQFAGVLGHEIAHSERRHTSRALQRQLGIQLLLDIVLGKNQGAVSQVLVGIGSLRFSRDAETEADEYSVRYLKATAYQCNGAAGFFNKMEEQGGAAIPEFLSSHPSPGNRIENINALADELKCNKNQLNPNSYEAFKRSLP